MHKFVESFHECGADRLPGPFMPPAGGVLVRSDWTRSYDGNVLTLTWIVPIEEGMSSASLPLWWPAKEDR
jgi:hypothetical protein